MDHELLVVDSTGYLQPLLANLANAGWKVKQTQSLQNAQSILEQTEFPVGLIVLPDQLLSVNDRRSPELFPRSPSPIEWIAIIAPELLNNPQICAQLSGNIYDYHTLPVDPERLLLTVEHAAGIAHLNHVHFTPWQASDLANKKMMLVGKTAIMQELFKNIQKVASVDAPVLITGESGTGKELSALAIHEHSSRNKEPFIAINCGALPENLIQSELFGYEKGAFTGAYARKIGCIESAHGGTLFLDEIGELTNELQVNLLRFLQEKTIRRLGDHIDRPVDVRIIAATNVNLAESVRQGKFREDLYYRVHVLTIHTPPLRAHIEDIEPLAEYFFNHYSKEKNACVKGFSKAAYQVMKNHSWPGNVRELENRIRSALIMCEKRLICPLDLGLERRQSNRQILNLGQARAQAEKEIILAALRFHGDNVAQAAHELGTSRVTLYRMMKKYDININEHGAP